MINREIVELMAALPKKGKAIVLTGPRQVGKTTLLKSLFDGDSNVLWINGDDATIRQRLAQAGTAYLKTLVAGCRIVVIDEAQRIADIGLIGKQLVDQIPDIELYITGSSALQISGLTGEPMTGRKWSLQLFPLSFREMVKHHGVVDEVSLLKQRLLYGYYPEIVVQRGHEERRLKELSESYLYKDIFAIEKIQKSEKFERLLKLLAFQIGQQVSYHELSLAAGLDVSTVERYIDMLEKAFVVFRLPCFQLNKRNELKKSRKIYFTDNGIRNAIINQWGEIELRSDAGALWENWIMSERRKLIRNEQAKTEMYFWRTIAQQEVDLVEVKDKSMRAVEFKWNTHKKSRVSNAFTNAYPDAVTQIISPENFESFLLAL
jgi:predicted AAA+ superfamily ATPase